MFEVDEIDVTDDNEKKSMIIVSRLYLLKNMSLISLINSVEFPSEFMLDTIAKLIKSSSISFATGNTPVCV